MLCNYSQAIEEQNDNKLEQAENKAEQAMKLFKKQLRVLKVKLTNHEKGHMAVALL